MNNRENIHFGEVLTQIAIIFVMKLGTLSDISPRKLDRFGQNLAEGWEWGKSGPRLPQEPQRTGQNTNTCDCDNDRQTEWQYRRLGCQSLVQ